MNVKISDFGFAVKLDEDQRLSGLISFKYI